MQIFPRFFARPDRSRQGVALVIVLAFVVLLTGLIVAFFSQAVTERQVSNSSLNDTQADVLAHSALDSIVGDIRQEIANGSSVTMGLPSPASGTPIPIYDPAVPSPTSAPTTSSPYPPYMVPTRYGNPSFATPAPGPSATPTDPVPNLVRRSMYITAATTPPPPMALTGRASQVSTISTSVNNRTVKLSRWNEHYLLPVANPAASPADNTPVAAFTPPDWVFVTPGGPAGILSVPSAAVVGRYGYAIYNEGGLLDANVAGYPSPMPAGTAPHPMPNPLNLSDFGYARKGAEAFADLTQLPVSTTTTMSQTQVNNLIGWRNYASAQASGDFVNGYSINATGAAGYYDVVRAATSGFIGVNNPSPSPSRTDQAFPNRQSLLKYCRASGLNPYVAQYFTTFSRATNAPNWEPRADAALMGGGAKSLGQLVFSSGLKVQNYYAYNTNEDSPAPFTYPPAPPAAFPSPYPTPFPGYNRRIPNVRVTKTFTRLDGTQAVVGEPLIKNRFDLNKLAWLAYPGQSGAVSGVAPQAAAAGVTAADIYHYFGLTNIADTAFLTNSTDVVATGAWSYNHTNANSNPPNPPTQAGTMSTFTPFPAGGSIMVPTWGSAAAIMTLDQVAAAGREPDFFELLQAGILQGSLGMCAGDPTQANASPTPGALNAPQTGGEFYRAQNNDWRSPMVRTDVDGLVVNAQEKYQIMQIGVNMIDQADSDGYPTEVILNCEHFYGIENLPYLNGISDTALRASPNVPVPPVNPCQYQAYVHRWMVPSLWNPHQNATTPPATGPANLRFYTNKGFFQPSLFGLDTSTYYSKDFSKYPAWVSFQPKNNKFFVEPALLDYNTSVASPPRTQAYVTGSFPNSSFPNNTEMSGIVTGAFNWQRVGIYTGFSFSPDCGWKVPACAFFNNLPPAPQTGPSPPASPSPAPPFPNPPMAPISGYAPGYTATLYKTLTVPPTVNLQYLDGKGYWHNYEEVRGLIYWRNGRGDPYMEPNDPVWTAASVIDSKTGAKADSGVAAAPPTYTNEYTIQPPTPLASPGVTPTPTPFPTTAVWQNPNLISGITGGVDYTPNMGTDPQTGLPTVSWGPYGFSTGCQRLTDLTTIPLLPQTMAQYPTNTPLPALQQEGWNCSFLDPRVTRTNMGVHRNLVLATNYHYAYADASFFWGPHVLPTPNIAPAGYTSSAQYWGNWANNVNIAQSESAMLYQGAVPSVASYINDRDGIQRLGDSAGWPSMDPQVKLTDTGGNQASRPLMLDRPFRSVGELGYVCRDDPWKSIDFMSAPPVSSAFVASTVPSTADSALLDLFCVGVDPSPSAPALGVVAGKININRAPIPVLQAILAGTAFDYTLADATQVNTTIAQTNANTMATKIVSTLQAPSSVATPAPLFSIADLPSLLPMGVSAAATPPVTAGSYPGNKAQREAMIRALVDVSDTRTWNLMVDVIAQSGRFSASALAANNAAALNQFIVTGEKHYWLHVAIDRFTGTVVARQLEPVSE